MGLILGIDAAWTATGSSGVALLEYAGTSRRIVACAPSYASFIDRSKGKPIDWRAPAGGLPDVTALLQAAVTIGNAPIDVVAIDMPIARTRISGRRAADQDISKAFAGAWASAHSPTPGRPGEFGYQLAKSFTDAGFLLATTENRRAKPALIEVYPLAALVRLLNLDVRPPYKVSRSARYWPELASKKKERIARLLTEWTSIENNLMRWISMDCFKPPRPEEMRHLSELKPYEDALDAIISAYVGALFLSNEVEPYGDGYAAIWVPKQRKSAQRPDEYLSAVGATLSEWNSPADESTSRNL